jgi:hypothetical protein
MNQEIVADSELTPQQRFALGAIYHRPLSFPDRWPNLLTYREFRKSVQRGSDCVLVPWCGMWLGIESDGYTHS